MKIKEGEEVKQKKMKGGGGIVEKKKLQLSLSAMVHYM